MQMEKKLILRKETLMLLTHDQSEGAEGGSSFLCGVATLTLAMLGSVVVTCTGALGCLSLSLPAIQETSPVACPTNVTCA